KPKKERASKYEDKVKFDGTFEDMIGMSVKDAERRMQEKQKAMKTYSVTYTITQNDRTSLPPENATVELTDFSIEALSRALENIVSKKLNSEDFRIDVINYKEV